MNTPSSPRSTDPRPVREVDLAVQGMTCASCVARVEKRLARLPGVEATVNLPLESAHVVLSEDHDDDALLAAVSAAGYSATVTRSRSAAPQAPAPDAVGHDEGPHGPAPDDEHAPAPGGPADGHDGHDMAADEHAGHGGGHVHTEYRGADLRRRLRASAVLTVPVVALSMVPAWQFTGWQWVVAALALPVVTWGAWPFHTAAAKAARHGASTMDTLVSIGVVAATLWSLWALLLGGAGEVGMTMDVSLLPSREHDGPPELYFEVAAVVTTFLLAGRYAEHRSKRRAGDALRSLLELGAKDADRVTVGPDGSPVTHHGQHVTERVAISALRVGDLFTVRPGEKVATDGEVVEGTSALDTSLLTGEPVPVDVSAGDAVTGATVNTSGHLLVRATRVGEETTLAQIGRLVSQAQTGKAPVARLADRISAVFVPVVLVLAVATFAGWLVAGAGLQFAFTAAVAVLIIACPCALGLATPTALLVGTGRAAQLGIVVKGPEILESTRRVDTVVLDKTGTVTQGAMALETVEPAPGVDADEALRYAAAVEARSEHPVARAVVDAATGPGTSGATGADGVTIGALQVFDFRSTAGGGVEAVVRTAHAGLGDGLGTGAGLGTRRVTVGRLTWIDEVGVRVPDEVRDAVGHAETDGATAVVVAWDGSARAALVLRDPVKPTSAQAVRELRELGLEPVLLTGDSEGAARAAAAEVGIEQVVARVLPQDKAATIERLQAEGRVVAMVGDGVNDAAALATADLGLAMGTGTDVAIEASDLTLVRGDLRAAATAVRISRRTLRIIKQNLFWAFAYNVAAIPLAAAGLLNPMIAGAAMAASSVIVVANSLRLRRAG
ncbi:heavy metal translocating P-type ATPase [Isoptericola dokdonensis]|uniref:Cation-transporting P-type ATPase B n=1 Tax=Isoptericola dokdonensis DS-3 TaxID=1300344 RepID=A0A168FPU3_9MICO|nr:heavy metal translocating P-type ATPase [Isoptericola dokdonensis]ANC32270.1 Copper-exporting P-type ATPase A [Isoptericola dokdonensis DS-3]